MTRETITWIPVDERLPDADETVLVCAPGFSEPVGMGWWDGIRCVGMGWWDGIRWCDFDGWPMHDMPVRFWAEMPKGPE